VSFKFRKLLIGENIKTNKLLIEEIERGVFNKYLVPLIALILQFQVVIMCFVLALKTGRI